MAGAPAVVEGAIDAGIRLDGENNLHFPGIAAFNRYDPFSIAIWIRIERIADRAVVLHRSRAWTDAGSQGYQFLLESGRPSWSLIHFWPGDAISIRGRGAHAAMPHLGIDPVLVAVQIVNGLQAIITRVKKGLLGMTRAAGGRLICAFIRTCMCWVRVSRRQCADFFTRL